MPLHRFLHYIFPMYRERVPVASAWNERLCIEQDGLYGLRISSKESFQSGDYVEGMWRKGLQTMNHGQLHRVLVLGCGAGSILYALKKRAKKVGARMEITAIERDPVMIALARAFYGDDFVHRKHTANGVYRAYQKMADTTDSFAPYENNGLKIARTDAREFLAKDRSMYSLVVIDLFHGFDVSPLLAEQSFIAAVYSHLASDGVILANIAQSMRHLEPLWNKDGYGSVLIPYKQNTMLYINPYVSV